MCKINLTETTTYELIKELSDRGLMTNSKSNELILNNLNKDQSIKLILTKGYPIKNMECRECLNSLNSNLFSYYLSRVDQNGYLMRSNALCNNCSIKSNKQRKKVLDSTDIPDKPKKGSKCVNCNRFWSGNWHRHHEGNDFISWLCGHCNMSFSDQRNKI
jgi:hypothetical protein